MADQQARITSVDSIERFRERLVIFMDHAGRALEDVDGELRRSRVWLESECLSNWQREVKKRERKLEAAEAELMTARLSVLKESETVQQMAVRRARQSVREAEEKIRVVKRWIRDFDSTVYPLARHLQQLRHHLSKVLPKGNAQLVEIMKSLDAYAELGRTTPSAPPAQSGESESGSDGGTGSEGGETQDKTDSE